jgi:hypothetical protein
LRGVIEGLLLEEGLVEWVLLMEQLSNVMSFGIKSFLLLMI